MAVHYFPDVKHSKEHAALQRAVEGYTQAPFDEWQQAQSQRIADLLASGDDVGLVEVTASEFVDYCNRTGAYCNAHTLTGFLWDKGKRLKVLLHEGSPAHLRRSKG